MARKINITGKKPTYIANIVEGNFNISRCRFGEFDDSSLDLRNFIRTPLAIMVLAFLCWLIFHLVFIHPTFVLDTKIADSYLVQYIRFLMGSNWTYALFGGPILGIVGYVVKKKAAIVRTENEI